RGTLDLNLAVTIEVEIGVGLSDSAASGTEQECEARGGEGDGGLTSAAGSDRWVHHVSIALPAAGQSEFRRCCRFCSTRGSKTGTHWPRRGGSIPIAKCVDHRREKIRRAT